MTPLEAAKVAVRLAGQHEDYAEALFADEGNIDWMIVAPARAGRLVVLRLGDGAEIVFSWCYVDHPLSQPPQAADWARQHGKAVWLADMVATPGLGGIPIGRAMRQALADLGITHPGQLIIHYRHRSDRYGGVLASASGQKGDVEVLFPATQPGRH